MRVNITERQTIAQTASGAYFLAVFLRRVHSRKLGENDPLKMPILGEFSLFPLQRRCPQHLLYYDDYPMNA
jgi:hypothetical protein